MKMVQKKDGTLTMVSLEESRLLNKIEMIGFTPINKLSEREQYLADELYKKSILRRGRNHSDVGYKTYPRTPI